MCKQFIRTETEAYKCLCKWRGEARDEHEFVNAVLNIYSNYCLWMLKQHYFLIFFFCCEDISRHVIRNKSFHVLLHNIFQIYHPGKSFTMHLSSFICFSLLFIMFLRIFGHLSVYLLCNTVYIRRCEFWFSNSSV